MVYIQKCNDYSREVIERKVAEIFEQAGGISEFARPGITVCIKPNLIGKKKPKDAATTHPSLVSAVACLCVKQGARVIIADSPGGLYEKNLLKGIYESTEMAKAATESGAELNYDLSTKEIDNPYGVYLKKLNIISPVANADVVINMAKLKTHSMMVYTGAVKNMFGTIPGLEKAEYHFKMSDYDQFANCLIDISAATLLTKKCLNIIDGIVAMEKDGPTAGDPRNLGVIISSKDPFEADLAAMKIINLKWERYPLIRNAIKRNLCKEELASEDISGVDIEEVKVKDFKIKYNDDFKRLYFIEGPLGSFLGKIVRPKPVVDIKKCKKCGECAKCCPAHTIVISKDKGALIDLDKCIRCYCCQELCPFKAIKVKKPIINRLVVSRRR